MRREASMSPSEPSSRPSSGSSSARSPRYSPRISQIRGDQDLPSFSVTGLWIMTGVMGLATAATILVVNRRRPYSPWVLLGLLPMAVSAPWILS